MKDAKGHGSDAHQSGVEAALNTQRPVDPARLQSHVAGAQGIVNDYFAKNFSSLTPPVLSIENPNAPKYLRVVRRDRDPSGQVIEHSGSVHSFINRETGDVLKADGWKTPAKGVRGNIHDEHNGLGRMGPHGPAYNK